MNFNLLVAWVQRNGLRIVAALALLALSGVLAAYNANGWVVRGLALLAVLALITEAIAFVMAVIADGAARSRQWFKFAICVLILLGAEAFNAAGSHMSWEADMAPKLDADRRAAQAALDRTRSEVQTELAAVNQRIEAAAPPSRGGPATTEAERQTWAARTADDRARRAAIQRRLDTLPIVAEVEPIFPEIVVWGFLGFLGFAKALGLFAVGMTVGKTGREGDNVFEFDASEAARRLVSRRRDRQAVA